MLAVSRTSLPDASPFLQPKIFSASSSHVVTASNPSVKAPLEVLLQTTTMWMLSDAVGFWRLLLLMVTAIVAMVVWIIVAHYLWERPQG